MKPRNVCISATASIQDAFHQLNANGKGILFAADPGSRIIGCVTDGDIRRQLLLNGNLDVPLSSFMNTSFVWARSGTPREQILKLLDHRVHYIPVLDNHDRLVDIYSRDEFAADGESEVFARGRAPARITFGGGGMDLTHFFVDQSGMVINAAINKYAHATLRKRTDSSVRIYSHDLKKVVESPSPADLKLDGVLDLLVAVVRLIQPTFGFEMEVAADFPVGSGLGGSASAAAAVIGCFNEFRSDPWDRHQISEMAFQAERLILNIPGGWQDQYATVFGGVNYMEFTADHNAILPLRLEQKTIAELEEALVLCYTGRNHDSGAIHRDQRTRFKASGSKTGESATRKKELTLEMKRKLLRGDVYGYGRLLHEAWLLKRQDSILVTDTELDRVYSCATANGALGGKILGAGGGGFFMFFIPPFQQYQVFDALSQQGYRCERVMFDEAGLQSWRTRLPDLPESTDGPQELVANGSGTQGV
ncbi:MAG: CBS domain-containing protein [Mycolicibacterium sp.]|uniref:GHMP family kinase ATP-binding protein n=1 Tax=Mycolicibacterium sp. TaxID=2320850 RepID=UPI003D11FDB6